MAACTSSPSYSGAEAGKSAGPGKLRLQRAVITPLHFNLGETVRPRKERKRKKGKRGRKKRREEGKRERETNKLSYRDYLKLLASKVNTKMLNEKLCLFNNL